MTKEELIKSGLKDCKEGRLVSREDINYENHLRERRVRNTHQWFMKYIVDPVKKERLS